ncbi:MAG: hypothetical protein R3E54_05520 [Halioglobus sp.]
MISIRRRSQHRHLPNQSQCGLLEQQREGAPLRARALPPDGHRGQGTSPEAVMSAVVLEEVEGAAALLLKIMGWTERATCRTGVASTALTGYLQVQLVGLRPGIQMLIGSWGG